MLTFAAYLFVAYIALRLFAWVSRAFGRDPGEVVLGLLGGALRALGELLAALWFLFLTLLGVALGVGLLIGAVYVGDKVIGIPAEFTIPLAFVAFGLGMGWFQAYNW